MPTYDYRCKTCLNVFEVRASLSEYETGLDPACPACGSVESVRMISAAGLVSAGGREAPAPRPSGGSSCGCGSAGCRS